MFKNKIPRAYLVQNLNTKDISTMFDDSPERLSYRLNIMREFTGHKFRVLGEITPLKSESKERGEYVSI